eukprot:TRINITY_DN4012_c0_g1_i1.p1 TRINITY_DN4012_c0_g1~~TRINITY_DN4012_c0_g1_i1.p1  ORF type:complete len:96 (-),score=9.82 TRINITY_DN4012_c0_g1_i1:58-345(-)
MFWRRTPALQPKPAPKQQSKKHQKSPPISSARRKKQNQNETRNLPRSMRSVQIAADTAEQNITQRSHSGTTKRHHHPLLHTYARRQRPSKENSLT